MASIKKSTSQAPATRVFCDSRYTSRVLILADARQLSVSAGQVIVAADDSVALGYLQEHPDFTAKE
ncbi:hypothetical protein EXN22_07615 [Pseudomonas tructae]|uniref:Uncharacterized protein n=1 Tax=Pseudomonas tructae TaxID=2518644 RepID=A0A411MFD1_9PSED|nr:hypothetical protein [Pseudomonas tructae]QBF25573.1 hypothetical protein EXN22_07615 [Pseudomonas tructae]